MLSLLQVKNQVANQLLLL